MGRGMVGVIRALGWVGFGVSSGLLLYAVIYCSIIILYHVIIITANNYSINEDKS